VLVERDRSPLGDDRPGLASDRLEPLAELLGVRDRRRQRGYGDRLGEVDDHLLPHRTAGTVGEVVDLVHHDEPEPDQRPRPRVEHVAEHLGGHHDHRGLPVDGDVAGEEADAFGTVARDEVVVLLVRERLDRRRVEALAAGLDRQVYGKLADQRLAGAGRRGDQHPVARLQRPAALDLERVELERVGGREVLEDGPVPGIPAGPCVGGGGRGTHRIRWRAHASTCRAPGTHSTVSGSAPYLSPSA
jgi:hypothetical protein